MPVDFPPVDMANEDGLLAIGGSLDTQTLTQAYSEGIFPWPVSKELPLTWFAPNPRGIIPVDAFHQPKSLRKFLAKNPFQIVFNQDFDLIIKRCAQAKRKHESGTWINQDIIKGYQDMFAAEKAYCVGAYRDRKLVGGLYGVCVGEIVSGESMFFEETNASKAALIALLERMKLKGLTFLDTQMVTPVIASLGGIEIERDHFMKMLGALDQERPRKDIFDS